MQRYRVPIVVALVLAALGAGFGWGFAAHKWRLFPFYLLRSLAQKTGNVMHDSVPVGAQAADLSLLKSLPYTGGTFDPDSASRDVLLHDPARAYQGINLYASRGRNAAYLLDMDGAVLHQWKFPATFHHVEVFPNGDLLAVRLARQIIRIDRDSQLLWSYEDAFHHGVWIDAEGRIHALVHPPKLIPEIHPTVPVRDERIVTLSAEGELLDGFSILDSFRDSPFAFLLPSVAHLDFSAETRDSGEFALDVLHNNHVEIFDGRLAERSDLFQAGNLLVSPRNINTIGIIDGSTRRVIWVWGSSNLTRQHQPTLLDNGHILIFNNGTEASQILELDPLTNRIVWLYEDPGEFFTRTRGSLQRLPNGNTLITESEPGYVFEVTPGGETVWRFANPDVDDEGIRRTIWRMTRLDPAAYRFLRRGS